MTVETATYISQLNPTYPAATDSKAEGDDHLRLLKDILKAQFPNFTATAVTATCAQLNSAATGSFTTVTATSNITINGAALIGYGTGAGGSVTQTTSKSTTVTLNKPCGVITMNSASLASDAVVCFLVNNSLVSANDTILVSLRNGDAAGGSYSYGVTSVVAGGFYISLRNVARDPLSETLTLNFTVIKGVVS